MIDQNLSRPDQPQGQFSSWDIQSGSGWLNPGNTHNMGAEMIPCEWQSTHNRRKRQRAVARDRPKSNPPAAAPPAPECSVLRVGDRSLLRKYYWKAFTDFQQLNCRAIAKPYVKLIEPRKQVQYPYNGRKVISGKPQIADPELTKPLWWPKIVPHKEPDHLKMDGKREYPREQEYLLSNPISSLVPARPHTL